MHLDSQLKDEFIETITKIKDICEVYLQKYGEKQLKIFTVNDAYNYFLETVSHKNKDYKRKFKPIMLLVNEFAGNVDIMQVDVIFISKLTKFLQDKNLASATVNSYTRKFRQILEASKMDIKFIKPKAARHKETAYLTEEELLLVENCKVPEKWVLYKDMFLWMCYTGLSYADIAKISFADIKNINGHYVLQKNRTKTNIKSNVPLISRAIELLTKYQHLPEIAHSTLNKHIKDICKLAGIDKLVKRIRYENDRAIEENLHKHRIISCHVARHTFATLLRKKGADIYSISKTLGHKNTTNTETYLHDTENQVIMDIIEVMKKGK